MIKRFFLNFLIFIITVIQYTALQSQTIDNNELQELLLKNSPFNSSNQIGIEDYKPADGKVSKNQSILNSTNNLRLRTNNVSNFEFAPEQKTKELSFLKRYFLDLTGSELKIYGAKEFNQPQDDSLLFYNTVGKDYQLAPGDVIQITITGLSSSNKSYQVESDGTITLDNM